MLATCQNLKIISSYNIYDFDWFEQVTSFMLIPTSRDKLNWTDASHTAEDAEDVED